MYKFDLLSSEYKQTPFPTWQMMREAGPVIRAKIPLVGKVWMFTSYEAASNMLRDHETFVRNPAKAGRKYVAGFLAVMPRRVRVLANDNMMTHDGEKHRRLRSLVDQAFQLQSVEAMREQLTALSNGLLDKIEKRLRSGETVDLLEEFARPLPLYVISELLGLPKTDRESFHGWGNRLSNVNSITGILRVFPGLWKIRNYLCKQIENCRNEPREGLLSTLVHLEQDGDRLNNDELLAMAFLLLVAGHETTVHLITTSLVTLFQHQEQFEKLRANWDLANSAVEEVMRYVSPAEIAKPRMLSCDKIIHEQSLHRGEYAVAMLGAANHDPAMFENPDVFNIERSPSPHLGFGTGIHVCQGMKLANAETGIALKTLFDRFPNLQLKIPADKIEWSRRIGFRSITRLPVKLG